MRIALLLMFALPVAASEPEPKVKPANGVLKRASAADAKTALERHADIERIDFAPQVAHLKIDVDLRGLTAPQAIERVAKAFDCEAQDLGKKRWRIAPAWQLAIRKKLENDKMTKLDVRDKPLGELLEFVRAASGLPIHLDRTVDSKRRITMQIADTNYGSVLALLTEPQELKWELRYGVIYIAPPDRLKQMPLLPPRIKGLEKRRIKGIQFEQTPLTVLADYMTALTGVRTIVARGVGARTVSINVSGVTVEQAFALMLYPWNMTASRSDGVIEMTARSER